MPNRLSPICGSLRVHTISSTGRVGSGWLGATAGAVVQPRHGRSAHTVASSLAAAALSQALPLTVDTGRLGSGRQRVPSAGPRRWRPYETSKTATGLPLQEKSSAQVARQRPRVAVPDCDRVGIVGVPAAVNARKSVTVVRVCATALAGCTITTAAVARTTRLRTARATPAIVPPTRPRGSRGQPFRGRRQASWRTDLDRRCGMREASRPSSSQRAKRSSRRSSWTIRGSWLRRSGPRYNSLRYIPSRPRRSRRSTGPNRFPASRSTYASRPSLKRRIGRIAANAPGDT